MKCAGWGGDLTGAAPRDATCKPGMGSPRLGQMCEIPRLRSWRVTGFPMHWLYFEAEDHLDVVRLLGDRAGHRRHPRRG
jgi:hypothetical protein